MRFQKALEQQHLSIARPTTGALYDDLKRAVLAIANDVEIYTTEKKYIGFQVGGRRIAAFMIHPEHIHIWLHLKPGDLTDRPDGLKENERHYSINVASRNSLNDAVELVRHSYLKNRRHISRTGSK